jgi:hypothetical protein
MSQLVTVQSLIDKVRLAADQQGSSLRTTDADITLLLSDAYARYIGQGSAAGWPYWLNYAEGTLPVGRSASVESDLPFGTTTFGTSDAKVEGVYRVELRLPDGTWIELEPVPFQRSNDLQRGGESDTGVPQQYWMQGGSGEDLNGNVQTIAFAPPADQAYQFRVWYANIEDLASVSTELEIGPTGGEWWLIWAVVQILAIRDHYPEQAQMAAAQQEKCWAELVKRVGGRNKNASFRVRDTRGLRRARGVRYSGLP